MQGISLKFSYFRPPKTALMDREDTWDIFICHSSLDKEAVAEPLADCLSKMDIKSFYDKRSIPKSVDIDEKILYALDHSKIGIVIYSDNFFDSPYTITERGIIYKGKLKGLNDVFPIYYQILPDDPRILKLPFYRRVNGSYIKKRMNAHKVANEIATVVLSIKEAEIGFLKENKTKDLNKIEESKLKKRKLIWLILIIAGIVSCIFYDNLTFDRFYILGRTIKKDSISNPKTEENNTAKIYSVPDNKIEKQETTNQKLDSMPLKHINSNSHSKDAITGNKLTIDDSEIDSSNVSQQTKDKSNEIIIKKSKFKGNISQTSGK